MSFFGDTQSHYEKVNLTIDYTLVLAALVMYVICVCSLIFLYVIVYYLHFPSYVNSIVYTLMYVHIFGYLVNKLEIWWVYLSPIGKKHNLKFRHIGYNVDPYGQSFFPKCISVWDGLAQEIAEANTLDLFNSKLAH